MKDDVLFEKNEMITIQLYVKDALVCESSSDESLD